MYFKRNWEVSDDHEPFVANWTLGMFAELSDQNLEWTIRGYQIDFSSAKPSVLLTNSGFDKPNLETESVNQISTTASSPGQESAAQNSSVNSPITDGLASGEGENMRIYVPEDYRPLRRKSLGKEEMNQYREDYIPVEPDHRPPPRSRARGKEELAKFQTKTKWYLCGGKAFAF